ncbi:hypothetical protein [Clostridium sp. OS1-26]|uniref:hypothetical protein n=1 Tax=Clostridium sp. OS1-26 TaxID=3070681 RepID=UPI0027E09F80|nr:hypothetical protein [Clostridium sp. OS1-26]WML35556.1 hypothetical protein RCG18_02020 [Clostridium sp. OS1-26]
MLDDELKHEGLIIDEKEAKRQFLEELRNKNMEENKKKENSTTDDNANAKNSEVVSNEESNIKETVVDEVANEEVISKEQIASSKDTESKKDTVEEEEIINEEPKNEEVVSEEIVDKEDTVELEESKDEETNKDEKSESTALVSEGSDTPSKERKSFLNSSLKVSLIDTAVTALTSLVGVYLFDVILRLIFGYYVADFKGVYIIIFLIILVLYPVIMQKSKCGKTLGQKFSKI